MKTAFGILARDLKLLLRNPIALLVVGALMVLPGLYAWYCIFANWDPYANTGNVPIVVVNEDAGTNSDLAGEVNIGKQVADQLRDNESIDWHFAESREQALDDTRAGLYYAAIVFPETLSADVVGIFTGSAAQPTIYYYPNQKYNAVAIKVTDSAVQTLSRQVDQAFASRVNETVLRKVQEGVDKARQVTGDAKLNAKRSLDEVQTDLQALAASLEDAKGSIEGWRSAAAGGQDALQGASTQIPSIRDALAQTDASLESLQAKSSDFTSRFNSAILDSATNLSTVSARTSSRVASASANISALSGNLNAVVVELRSYRDVLQNLADALGNAGLANSSDSLSSIIAEIDETLARLESASRSVSDAAGQASNRAVAIGQDVEAISVSISDASNSFATNVAPQLSSGVSSLARAAGSLSGTVAQFEPHVAELQDVLVQADDALVRALAAIDQAQTLLGSVRQNLQKTADDLGTMEYALQVEKLSELLDMNPDTLGSFISSPVKMEVQEVYPVSNYGTAVAPFYTNLALWVGCFILISLIKLEVSRAGFERATAAQRYFGRWLLLVMMALVQSQVICGVDILLGIDCANPAMFMASGAICSFAYMNLLYALAICFRNIGKTLCILVLIMQVPGSSGMYPIEMMPAFFQAVHPWLPFTYGIDAMREALCGMYGLRIAGDWLALLTLVPASLLLGLALRPGLMNLTNLFDVEMRKAGFFAVEEHGQRAEGQRIRSIVRTLLRSDTHADEIEMRSMRFRRSYPRLRRVGTTLLVAMPFVFLLAMLPFTLGMGDQMSVDVKLTALVVFLLVELAVMAGLIVLEHVHQSIAEEAKLLGMDILGDDLTEYQTLAAQADDTLKAAPDEMGRVAEGVREAVGEHVKHRKRTRDTRRRHGAVSEIFSADLRLGFQSPIGAVVIMLLVITPSLYAWFNIAGSWDPYANTKGLKVAVANDDAGYKGDLLPLTVNIGNSIEAQLRGNGNFDWQFVSYDEAISGIHSGEYYASIVIPESFSHDMLTYLVEDSGYPTVGYYTNKKENPIAPLITQKGADSIQENIRVTFTQQIDEAALTIGSDLLSYASRPSVVEFAGKLGDDLDNSVGDLQGAANEMRTVADVSGVTADVVKATGTAMQGVMDAAASGKASAAEAENAAQSAIAAFEQANTLLGDAVSQGSGGMDSVTQSADAALALLQDAAAGAPDVLARAAETTSSWKDALVQVQAIVEEGARNPDASESERAEAEQAAAKLGRLVEAFGKLEASLSQSVTDSGSAVGNVEQARADLQQLGADLGSGVSEVNTFFSQDVRGSVTELRGILTTVLDSTRSVVAGLEGSIGGLSDSTGGLSGTLTGLSGGLTNGAGQMDAIALRLANMKRDVDGALASGDVQTLSQMLLGSDTARLAERLAAPVQHADEAMFPVKNYGSSMAPFYTVLSLWVGALVMISTMKVHLTQERLEELRRRFRMKPRHEYLGRWGIFALVSVLQSLLVSLGDLFLLHIQCQHPVLFVLECIYIGLVFCLIVYTLTELFGDVGKAVCIILLIMQVAASGGTFPVEMLGQLLGGVAPLLPFYHGMTALQGCVAGIYYGDTFLYLVFMLGYVLLMLLIGIVARRPFRFVTDWVEEQLEKTHYM